MKGSFIERGTRDHHCEFFFVYFFAKGNAHQGEQDAKEKLASAPIHLKYSDRYLITCQFFDIPCNCISFTQIEASVTGTMNTESGGKNRAKMRAKRR